MFSQDVWIRIYREGTPTVSSSVQKGISVLGVNECGAGERLRIDTEAFLRINDVA